MENCLEIQFLLDMLQSPSVIDSVLTSVTHQEHQNEQQQQTSGTSFSCISCSGLIDATAMSSRPWSTRLERAHLGQMIDFMTFLMERENDLSSDDESFDSSLSLLGDEALRITRFGKREPPEASVPIFPPIVRPTRGRIIWIDDR